ncbi:chemotaxis protein CheD [Halobacteriaceae archaeon GCM10025711]
MKTYQRDPSVPERERLFVGVSEWDVASAGQTLVAYGLGACVAVVLYDPEARVGGLAHPMLPRQDEADSTNESKFVDPAVEHLLRETLAAGATYGSVEGYVVGGADLIDLPELPREVSERNAEVALAELDRLGVPVAGTDVGGTHGRTVELDVGTGALRVSTAAGEPTLLRSPEED